MEKNKIALITYSLSSGGLERIVANSSFMFSSLGYEVHLFVINSDVSYQFQAVLHCYQVDKLTGLNKVKAYLKIKKDLKEQNFKLIIDHRFRLNKLSEFFWQKLIYKDKNVLMYIHSSHIYSYLFKSKSVNRFLYGNRKFICVSKGIEDLVNEKFPFLDTQTIYNPIKLIVDNQVIQDKFIVTIARMDHSNVKQIDVLIKCYSQSILPKLNVKLYIIGDGVRMSQMQKLTQELNISDLVVFKGFIDKPYIYLKNALYTVLTSKYEGLPTVLIESLFANTPIISFDCETGPSEIIVDNVNGILVENQNSNAFIDAMNKLILDVELYQFMKENINSTLIKFEEETIISDWQKILTDIN